MPCALEETVMAKVREHVECGSLTNKTINLYYHNTYGHQSWQDGDLP